MSSRSQTHVGKVTAFDQSSGGEHDVLTLQGSESFRLSRKSKLHAVWVDMVQNRRETGLPLYIEFLPLNREAVDLFLPSLHRVVTVAAKPEDGRLMVNLFMAPSNYFLRENRPDFQELRRKLETYQDKQEEVLVTAHPDTQEILDARPK